jgi:hypothetical protein
MVPFQGLATIRQDDSETTVHLRVDHVEMPGLLNRGSWFGTFDEREVAPLREGEAVVTTEAGDDARIIITNEYAGSRRRFKGNGPPLSASTDA